MSETKIYKVPPNVAAQAHNPRAAITMAYVRGLFARYPLLVTLWCQFKVWSSLLRSLWRRHLHCHARPALILAQVTT